MRIRAERAAFVAKLFARGEVIGVTDVQGVVCAAKDGGERHSTTMPIVGSAMQLGSRWRFHPLRGRHEAVCPSMRRTSSLRLAVGLLRAFDSLLMACHEGGLRLPQAGGSRIEWYRYGDSNPGILTENQVS